MNELYMEINLLKLKSNIEAIKTISKKEVIPVIKSNAYGMGDLKIARFLEKIGILNIAVVDMNEALRILNNNFKNNILLLNSISEYDYKYLDEYPNLIVTINSLEDIKRIIRFQSKNKIRLHIQIDTGMNRLGFNDLETYQQAINIIENQDNLVLEGIYTHFSSPENRNNQEKKFSDFINKYPYKVVHCAASSTYSFSNIGNYVRVGLDIYGEEKPNNKQILKVACKPLKIHKVKKGDSVGYDEDYKADEDIIVAVLPIGYSNGYRRSLKGFPVLVDGKKYYTIGKICMNHTFVKVDNDVKMDSEFIITSDKLPISEMAKYLNTVSHEILCMMNIENKIYIE